MDGAALPSDLPFAPENAAIRVRALLLHSGMSKREFAEALAIAPAQVSHLIQGKYLPSAPVAYRMTKVFGITADWIWFDNASSIVDVKLRNSLLRLIPQARAEMDAETKKGRSPD